MFLKYIYYKKQISYKVCLEVICHASLRAKDWELTEEKEEESNDEGKRRRRGKRKTWNKCLKE